MVAIAITSPGLPDPSHAGLGQTLVSKKSRAVCRLAGALSRGFSGPKYPPPPSPTGGLEAAIPGAHDAATVGMRPAGGWGSGGEPGFRTGDVRLHRAPEPGGHGAAAGGAVRVAAPLRRPASLLLCLEQRLDRAPG